MSVYINHFTVLLKTAELFFQTLNFLTWTQSNVKASGFFFKKKILFQVCIKMI